MSSPNDPIVLQEMLRELFAEYDKLRLSIRKRHGPTLTLIRRLTRHQFGRRSEQLTVEQLQFGTRLSHGHIPFTLVR